MAIPKWACISQGLLEETETALGILNKKRFKTMNQIGGKVGKEGCVD